MNPYFERHLGMAKQNTLFLHGNLASHRWWHPMLKQWKSPGPADLIFSDWRGCGQNEAWPIDKQFTLQDLAEDQLGLLNQLGLRSDVALVGHSLGGLIGLQMMALDPSRFSRAVLLDSVGARGVIFDDSMYDAFKQMAASPDLTRMVILSTVMRGEELPEDFKEAIAKDAYKAVQGIGASVLQILKTVDLSQQVTAIKNPVLILHGAQDQVIPPTDAKELHQLLAHSELEILPNQGHCWNIEDPRAFAKRTRQWLDS